MGEVSADCVAEREAVFFTTPMRESKNGFGEHREGQTVPHKLAQ